ncbi:ParB/Srx family N-terminal domain-containing protein [Lacticaseibacillus paracasei]|uniref:ParB/Srx family N-terminal domain-containing protein n=1 Tax=Lacticaseibacillus paracasei TaxID=1597 RepID=UPI0005EBCD87|nr:ParB N-terminal domain-containing protein [Lacticaseibacillus paracasei]
MDLLVKATANKFKKTGATKKVSIPGQMENQYPVYSIPLSELFYNNQNGRINTSYKQYQAEKGALTPEPGNSEYNRVFQKLVYDSNPQALKDTLDSIKQKTQQEPGVVLPDGRVIDGNRRFTALRMIENQDKIAQSFETIILPLDSETDEKTIKELELDLQLGREERVNYDPIDRIFDVYNTIKVTKLMTVEEYKKASGAGNSKGINRDIRLAELILRFIGIVSPGGHPVDKFYLARELKLDGPVEEIESTLSKMEDSDKESITDAVLVNLAISKVGDGSRDSTRVMRDLKINVLKNPKQLSHYLDAVDDKVDTVVDAFEANPVKSASDLKLVLNKPEIKPEITKFQNSTGKLIRKGKNDSKRKKALVKLQEIRDSLDDLHVEDFKELTIDENFEAKDVLSEITDILYKLKNDLKNEGGKR